MENVYDTAYHAKARNRESGRRDPGSAASNDIGRVRPNCATVIYREKNEGWDACFGGPVGTWQYRDEGHRFWNRTASHPNPGPATDDLRNLH